MDKWEYKKVIMFEITENYLNFEGVNGWELVTFYTSIFYDKAIFKRKIQ